METEKAKAARAEGRFLRNSSRKMNRVLDLIRGKRVEEALAILRFTPKRAARHIEKIVKSAIANAENNHEMEKENLYIARAIVEQGPTIPRIMHMSMGRIGRVRKRMCHTTIVVKEKAAPVEKTKKSDAGAAVKETKKVAKKAPKKEVAESGSKG
jgi:large subunit ribosomal protein L22